MLFLVHPYFPFFVHCNFPLTIGDGETDIPCFRLVKDRGGKSIAVYKPSTKGAKEKSQKLIEDGRVNYISPGDYRDGKLIDRIVKTWIDSLSFNEQLNNIKST